METWHKFNLDVLRHPKLRSFRSPAQIKILQFLALSVRYDAKGVVPFLDDEIALDLNVPLHHWLTLRDGMIERGIVRQVATPAGDHVYEVAFWILPDQGNPGGTVHDGRSLVAWPALPDDPIDRYADDADSPVDTRTARERTAERVALHRYRAKMRAAENRYPTRAENAEFLERYRAERAAPVAVVEVAPSGAARDGWEIQGAYVGPFGVPNVTDLPLENVTEACNAAQPVTSRVGVENRLEERDNNSFEVGTGCNDVTDVTNVTSGEAVTFGAEAVTSDEEAEKAVVVALLSEHGKDYALSVSVAEELFWKYGADMCLLQLKWLEYRRPPKPEKGTRAGQLRDSIAKNWPEPPEARKAEAAAREFAAWAARDVLIAAEAEAANARLNVEQVRLDLWIAALDDRVRAEIALEAETELAPILKSKLAASREASEPMPHLVYAALHVLGTKIAQRRMDMST